MIGRPFQVDLAHRGYTGHPQGSIPGGKRRHTANSAAWTVAVAHRTQAQGRGIGSGSPLSDGTGMGGLV